MKKILALTLVALGVSNHAAFAQMKAPGATAGVNASLTKLFGDITAFSAKAEVHVYGPDQKEKIMTPMTFALLDNKVRVEIDMTKMVSKDIPADAAASMKQMGMERVVSIMRPDLKATYVIFPALESVVKMPMPKEELAAYEKKPKLEKTALGKETLDGHPCVKNKVVVTDADGHTDEATLWNATDLKDFPVQIMSMEKGDSVTIRYRDVRFAKPDAKQFATPTGYKEYDDIGSLMQGVMKKMMKDVGAGEAN